MRTEESSQDPGDSAVIEAVATQGDARVPELTAGLIEEFLDVEAGDR